MSRRKRESHAKSSHAPAAASSAGGSWPGSFFASAGVRETIESVIVAVVLAVLIRTFEAEAFVIPTGSMAPALMGDHKDLECPVCHCLYQVSASDKSDGRPAVVDSTTCPMCGFHEPLIGDDRTTYNGDRVLVDKFCYQWKPLERWDVVVFHYPRDASKNYIKRLVGLPGETVHIAHGALWIRSKDKPDEHIARKPPEKLLAMLEPVFDNDYLRGKWQTPDFPMRWSGTGWKPVDEGVVFKTKDNAPDGAWLRYQHLVPSFNTKARVWAMRTSNEPALISDFLAYDAGYPEQRPPDSLGLNWVGDLAFECTMESRSDQGQAVIELVKGGRRFQCRIGLASGEAALSISGPDAAWFHPTAKTSVKGKTTHRILFSNVDDQLLLWIDGRLVPANSPKADSGWSASTCYDSRKLNIYLPTKADLAPVGVAGTGGAALTISHLKIMRNIYYVADKTVAGELQNGRICEFTGPWPDLHDPDTAVRDLTDPDTWGRSEDVRDDVTFSLGPDQFFMLGDNSACSADGRLWGQPYWVDRDLIIGKAIVIYWPHSWDEVTIGGHHIPFPFFPNFRKMGFVR